MSDTEARTSRTIDDRQRGGCRAARPEIDIVTTTNPASTCLRQARLLGVAYALARSSDRGRTDVGVTGAC